MNAHRSFWTPKGKIKRWTDVERMERVFHPLKGTSRPNPKWIFRAERPDQHLRTSLGERFELDGTRNEDKTEREREIIRKFQRGAALYLEREPDKDDILEWLAVMRHRGAETRLLDWTYSFYVAVYLALNKANKGVIWALNTAPINRPEPIVKRICEREDGFRRFSKALLYYLKQADFLGIRAEGDKLIDLAIASYLIEYPLAWAYPVNPFRLNDRLSIQRGLFLMPGDITISFAENLIASFGNRLKTRTSLWKVEVGVEEEDRKAILKKLKDMNISNEVLFPGLDGFARSVGEGVPYLLDER